MEKNLTNLTKFILTAIIIGVCFGLNFGLAQGADDLKIFFSGILRGSDGVEAESGGYNIIFSLYDDSSSTQSLWHEEFSSENKVNVVGGRFKVILGSENPFGFDLQNQKYWLGIAIGGEEDSPVWDAEMTPRIPVVTLESLFLEGAVELSEEDFIKTLIEEFEKNATSTENITQEAFLKFLQERLSGSDAMAVIISPATLNLLFDKIIDYKAQEPGNDTIWQTIFDFFRRILDTIAKGLTQIFEKISEIFGRLSDIDQKTKQILDIVSKNGNQNNDTVSQKDYQNVGVNFLVEDFGETVIAKGEKSVKVFSNYLTINAKIFVTPKTEIPGIWWISDRRNGEYFEISILTPPEEDLKLDYWIVTPKDEMLTVFPLPELEDSENADLIEQQIEILENSTSVEIIQESVIEATSTEQNIVQEPIIEEAPVEPEIVPSEPIDTESLNIEPSNAETSSTESSNAELIN